MKNKKGLPTPKVILDNYYDGQWPAEGNLRSKFPAFLFGFNTFGSTNHN